MNQRRDAFSLLELLVVIATIAVLSSLLLPALSRARSVAYRAKCTSNLHQLGLAAQMYFDDHEGFAFRYAEQALPNGAIYWFGFIENGADGSRNFDPTQGALYPYLGGRGVEICPSLNYNDPDFKLKAKGASYGYGYNRNLSSAPGAPLVNLSRVTNSSQTVLFADAGQVNTWIPPASPSRPMWEEHYYLSQTEATTHFRHHGTTASALFMDGHVEPLAPEPGSTDLRISSQVFGRFRAEYLIVP